MQGSNVGAPITEHSGTIFIALELSQKNWVLTIHSPDRDGLSQPKLLGGDSAGLLRLISDLRERVRRKLGRMPAVVTCYEAGYDGFWLHRLLSAAGITNYIFDPASIAVEQRGRRAKTDRIDGKVLLRTLMAHVRGEPRLIALVELVNDETRSDRPGREAILGRLLEVLLIEALRSAAGPSASAGLLRGLHDDHLAAALRCIHDRPAQAWTVAALAREAALSRSAFFDRFQRAVGVAPMAYVTGWRMALAKAFLRREGITVAEAAGRVGYSSASTFSVAFTRHVGTPPALYARGA